MQFVIFHFFGSYWLEGSQSYVQRDLGNFDPACANLLQNLRREVQPRRRRRDRSCPGHQRLGVHRLVAFPVRRAVARGRCRAEGARVRCARPGQKNRRLGRTGCAARQNCRAPSPRLPVLAGSSSGGECQSKASPRSRSFRPGRTRHSHSFGSSPTCRVSRTSTRPRRKSRAAGLCGLEALGPFSAPVAVKPGRKHPRIVHDQQVIRPQQVGKFAKPPVLPVLPLPTLTLPAPRQAIVVEPCEMQQARPRAVRQWLLRNTFGRQIILEFRDKHRGDYRLRADSRPQTCRPAPFARHIYTF